MNTSVTYISGQPGRVPKRRYINYGSMTDGELRLALIAEQYRLLGEFYQSSEHLENEQALIAALQDGIKKGGTRIRVPGDLARELNRQISLARRKQRPAAGRMYKKRNARYGVGDPLIENISCDHLLEYEMVNDGYGQTEMEAIYSEEYTDCENARQGIELLNEHLEGSSNHMLYEYIAATEANQVLITKGILHKIAIGKMAEITSVDRDNLRLWTRNGIMRNNAAQPNGQPIQPEDVIATMRAKAQQITTDISSTSAEVGAVSAFIALLPSLLAALGAAVGATVGLINSLKENKRQELLYATQGMGVPDWGGQMIDFNSEIPPGYNFPTLPGGGSNNNLPNLPGGGGNNNSSTSDLMSSDNMPLLLGGGALALLLLSNKK